MFDNLMNTGNYIRLTEDFRGDSTPEIKAGRSSVENCAKDWLRCGSIQEKVS